MVEPKFEIYKDAAGKFRFRLRAANNEIIAVSEAYESKSGCKNGIESVMKSASKAMIHDLEANVKKRAGHMEKFDKAKLKRSLRKAGATEELATECAEKVALRVEEGMTTAEIKQMAAKALGEIDQGAADAYLTFTKSFA